MSQPLSSSWFILCPSPRATPFLTWAPCLSLCVTSFHTLSLSLPVTFTLSQNYDDIDLENEPWYKFFSELEFGRPVSQGRSCFFNHNPVVGLHPLSPPHPWLFLSLCIFILLCLFPPVHWVGLVVWACGICWVLWIPFTSTLSPPWREVVSRLCCRVLRLGGWQALSCSVTNPWS